MTEMYARLTGCDYIRDDLARTASPSEPGDSHITYLRTATAMLDHIAEQDFYMKGSIDEVVAAHTARS